MEKEKIQDELMRLLHAMEVEAFNSLRMTHAATRFNFDNGEFNNHVLEGIYLFNCDLRKSNFNSSDLGAALFCGSDLTGASFEFSFLVKTVFGPPKLISSEIDPLVHNQLLHPAVLDEVNFQNATIISAVMRECSMRNTDFRSARVKDTDVANSGYENAVFN